MTDHIWREADAGVMVWEPTSEAVISQAVEEQPQHEQSHTATDKHLQGKRQLVTDRFLIRYKC